MIRWTRWWRCSRCVWQQCVCVCSAKAKDGKGEGCQPTCHSDHPLTQHHATRPRKPNRPSTQTNQHTTQSNKNPFNCHHQPAHPSTTDPTTTAPLNHQPTHQPPLPTDCHGRVRDADAEEGGAGGAARPGDAGHGPGGVPRAQGEKTIRGWGDGWMEGSGCASAR